MSRAIVLLWGVGSGVVHACGALVPWAEAGGYLLSARGALGVTLPLAEALQEAMPGGGMGPDRPC